MSFNIATPGLKMLIHTLFKYCVRFPEIHISNRTMSCDQHNVPSSHTVPASCCISWNIWYVIVFPGPHKSPSLRRLMPTKQQWRPLKEGMSMMCLAMANIFRKSRAWATAGLLFGSSVLAKQCAGSFSQHSAQIFRCQRNLFGHDQVL